MNFFQRIQFRVIVGLTAFSNKYHLIRAVLEATCFQTADIINSMHIDSDIRFSSLRVDGGMTANSDFLQQQADILDMKVEKSNNPEATALGAAIAAGLAVGFWKNKNDVRSKLSQIGSTTFYPSITSEKRTSMLAGWNKAVQKSFDWIDCKL